MSDKDVVQDSFGEWGKGSMIAGFEKYLADDAVWKNSGFPDCEGKAACLRMAQGFVAQAPVIEVELLSFAAEGDWVFGERINHGKDSSGTEVMAPAVNGAMKVQDGKIVYWYDYFDPRPFLPGS